MRVVVVADAVLVVLVLATTGVAWLGCGCCGCCFSFGGMVILMRMQDAGVGEGQAKTSWVFSVLWGLVEGLRLVGIVVAGSRLLSRDGCDVRVVVIWHLDIEFDSIDNCSVDGTWVGKVAMCCDQDE